MCDSSRPVPNALMCKLFPTDSEYEQTYAKYPVPQLARIDEDIEKRFTAHESLFLDGLTLQEWFIHLTSRTIQARQAYHLMMYFFDLGIPDDRPFISPGKGGVSVEFFPDFEDLDYSKLSWFNFYADCFGYKLFSAFDSIGHILAVVHGLERKRPSFHDVATALKGQGKELGERLLEIWDREKFNNFLGSRHDATHNFLPGVFGGSVVTDNRAQWVTMADGTKVKAKSVTTFGVGRYTASKEAVGIANGALDMFEEVARAAGLRGSKNANQ